MPSVRGRSNSPKPIVDGDVGGDVEMNGSVSPSSVSKTKQATNGDQNIKSDKESRSKSGSKGSRSSASPNGRSRSRSRSRSMSLHPDRPVEGGVGLTLSLGPGLGPGLGPAGGGSRVIEVLKLTKHVTAQHLHEIFGTYGTIKEVDLPIVKRIGSHLGKAIITFDTAKAAQKAISHMDRGQLDGSLITVSIHRAASPPRAPAALRRGGDGYRAGIRYAGSGRGPPYPRRGNSPPRRSFGGRSRSPPRRSFGGDGALSTGGDVHLVEASAEVLEEPVTDVVALSTVVEEVNPKMVGGIAHTPGVVVRATVDQAVLILLTHANDFRTATLTKQNKTKKIKLS
ncbi:hypothetical protein BY996DRAFT_6412029 [Phakopsora pachyrhizi]|nr:hypothetical protein BY996DRAFT_6412029 [Phakopsora pachyrhizi]